MIDHEARAKALAMELICDNNPVLWDRYNACPEEMAKILAYGRAVERQAVARCVQVIQDYQTQAAPPSRQTCEELLALLGEPDHA